MDNRLRFLYPVISEMWGHGHKWQAGKGKTGASAGAGQEEKPLIESGGVKRSENKSKRSVRSACQEKPLWRIMGPYRKPTQVDRERILRSAEEALPRNSAK